MINTAYVHPASVKSGAPRRTTKDNNNLIKYCPKLKEQGAAFKYQGWKKGWDEDVDPSTRKVHLMMCILGIQNILNASHIMKK